MHMDALIVGFTLALTLFSALSGSHTIASAPDQIAYGANLTQMRPPIYDFAYPFNSSISSAKWSEMARASSTT